MSGSENRHQCKEVNSEEDWARTRGGLSVVGSTGVLSELAGLRQFEEQRHVLRVGQGEGAQLRSDGPPGPGYVGFHPAGRGARRVR